MIKKSLILAILVYLGFWCSPETGEGVLRKAKTFKCDSNLQIHSPDSSTQDDINGLKTICENTSAQHPILDFLLGRNCQDAARSIGDEIKQNACSSPNLKDWNFHTIVARGDPGGNEYCHDALLVVSNTGHYYYYDPFISSANNFYEVVPENVNGEWRFKPKDTVKIPIFRFPDCKTDYYVYPGENDKKPGGQYAPKPHHFKCPVAPLNVSSLNDTSESKIRTCAFQPTDEETHIVQLVGSFDPNDKVGSQGSGEGQFISGDQALTYSVFFENVETATASAQEVLVTDQLDIANLDLSSLSLGPIAFGEKEIIPPPGVSWFNSEVDLRPDYDLFVRIDVRLNIETGLLAWRLISIDPNTGKIPTDPLAGFLPPNVIPPEGDGSVLFTVAPKAGLPTGTEIRNKALIIFDNNPPIETPEWLNTLDNDYPISQVLPLNEFQESAEFVVEWSGTDIGAGVKDFSIYVSEDSGLYYVWLENTSEVSSTFVGEDGKSYAFYSVARDQAGNLEPAPESPDATTIVVLNRPPVIESVAGPIEPIAVGISAILTGSFTDPNAADTHTATLDWGDGSTSEAVVNEADGSGTVTGTHVYSSPGVYVISLTLTDAAGEQDTATSDYVVVYDPEGGFVTGGGWIWSPAGAYASEADLEGKANFGFVAKYKKGADVPVGEAEFQFKVAELNFHSASYQWLVVAGAKAMFKGVGTINGEGSFGFMISAVDAKLTPSTDQDLFRIKIWDSAADDMVVYDNQMDADDDADPTTAIQGGSIVVHTK